MTGTPVKNSIREIVASISLMDFRGSSVRNFIVKNHLRAERQKEVSRIRFGPLMNLHDQPNARDALEALYLRKIFYNAFYLRRTKSTVSYFKESLPPKNEVIIWLKL